MSGKEYFLGFDIGTGSVGWAVTDTDYNLIKINRKYAWGSVLFDTSQGAAERRTHRCERRRRKRERERLSLLRELFESEIYKVDSGFFHRLQESRYVYEDKRDEKGTTPELPYALFVDSNYTDVDYHKEFPTIYHLRHALITEEDRVFDVRLVYLAIAHILKHRGHFLKSIAMEGNNVNTDFGLLINNLTEVWNDICDNEVEQRLSFSEEQKSELEKILKNPQYTKTEKRQKMKELFDVKDKAFNELLGLMVGGSVSLSKLFNKSEYDNMENKKVCFDDISYEEKESDYIDSLGDDFAVIEASKAIYDQIILCNILGDSKDGYLSSAKVQEYEKHKEDLKRLKLLILEKGMGTEKDRKRLYKQAFGIPEKEENNYSVYVGMVSTKGRKRPIKNKKCTNGDFYKFLTKNILPNIHECEDKNYIENEISLGRFMPKQRVRENSVIPYQLHGMELKKILSNCERYLSFLKDKDESGISVSEKIIMLLEFRIPYYVGPLNENSKNAWVVRGRGKVTPWTFNRIVDEEASAKAFIEKMTSRCTYLKKENVLPMSSLVYEKFMVLNEINKIKLYSEPISVELKQRIFENLFQRKLKVTVKKLIEYLKKDEGYKDITKEDISGIDTEIKSSLKSYHAFKKVFTGTELSEQEKEDIIKDMTLFGAEPKLLKKRLSTKYPNYSKQLDALTNELKCKDWGRLSYKLLSGIAIEVPGLGNVGTVMYQLWNTNRNLMQILEDKDSPYSEIIIKENGVEEHTQVKYELIDELYVAPSVKRQIWKAVQVLQEISGAMGGYPKRVFVEMAREKAESKRSITRKDRLMELYRSVKTEKVLYEQLSKTDNDALRSDKLFLYYTQLGKCAYTGRTIAIEDLTDDNMYDIDHIYPRSKTGDDSLDNRVLVYKPINEDKSDEYPLDSTIQASMRDMWNIWKAKGLISDEKYKRLIRTTKLTNEELTGFINRQLVETRQSTKAFTEVIKSIVPKETEIVYSKAGNVSRFRQQYKIVKVRDINDVHHAKDAYLNIVVGNVYHLKFTKDIRKYFSKNGTYRTYNLIKMFDYNVDYLDETAWRAGKGGTIVKVKETLRIDKVLVTKQTFERRGELFKVQPLKKGLGQVPLKSSGNDNRLSDIGKYGGYDRATVTYFTLIEGKDKKENKVRYIAPVELHVSRKLQQDKEYAREYFEKVSKLHDIKIIKEKIRIQSLLMWEGFKMRIGGRTGSRIVVHNANQLYMEEKYYKPLKEIFKFIKDREEKKDAKINGKIEEEMLCDMYHELIRKIREGIYKTKLNSFADIMSQGYEKFQEMSIDEKSVQIYEILKLFKCTAESANLINIGGKGRAGELAINSNITKYENMVIIYQSVTGIYERIERLNE